MPEPDYIRAHRHSSDHRAEVMASELCGCFYCRRIYSPDEIESWIDDGQTAICPRCGIDSVIGSASGFPVTIDFLRRMKTYWFARRPPA